MERKSREWLCEVDASSGLSGSRWIDHETMIPTFRADWRQLKRQVRVAPQGLWRVGIQNTVRRLKVTSDEDIFPSRLNGLVSSRALTGDPPCHCG